MTADQVKHAVLEGLIPSAISDTGATSTAGSPKDIQSFDVTGELSTKVFRLPDGSKKAAQERATLRLPLRDPANQVDIVPGIEQTLLSGGKMAEAGYIAIYDDEEVNFYNKTAKIHISEEAVLKGYKCKQTKLWRVPLQDTIQDEHTDTLILDSPCGLHSLNTLYEVEQTTATTNLLNFIRESISNVYDLPSTQQTIRYLHAAAGFPTKATWLKRIQNYQTWPMVNVKNVNKYFPESEETQQGHMKNQRQGVRSTKIKLKDTDEEEQPQIALPKKNDILISTYDTQETMYTDQTGKFPFISSRGNKYMMVLYHVDSNSIWAEPMKNRTEGEMILTRANALERMHAAGIKPTHQVLDNEASKEYQQAITDSGMTFQKVPPDDHRRNVAERAIQTWKDHFISVFSGTSSNFPTHLWCQLLPQMEKQLCLQRQTNANPNVCTYTHLYGPHDYNAVPFVPIGMECMVHDKPAKRRSFAQHCTKGWVLSTSPLHYRCWEVWMKETRATRISGTIFFKHKYLTNPAATPADAIVAATNNLRHALTTNRAEQHRSQQSYDDLKRMAAIITNNFRQSTLPPPSEAQRNIASLRRSPRLDPTNDPTELQFNTWSTSTTTRRSPRLAPTSTPTNNPAPSPRVAESAPSPRVTARAPSPRVPVHIVIDGNTSPPAMNTRSSRTIRSITEEAMLTAIEMTRGFANEIKPRQLASRQFPIHMLNAILNEETGKMMEYRHLLADPKYRSIYSKAFGKEVGRLAQGIPDVVEGTDTITFIFKHDIPADDWNKVTYARICANYRPEKDDPYRIRITLGGDQLDVDEDCGTPTADMITTKLLFNSVISTPGAKFATVDVKDFYLCTPMNTPVYMRLKLSDIPENIIDQYNLREKVDDKGFVYCKVTKGMYGHPAAGIMAQRLLEKRLNADGYYQSKITPGYWKHNTRPISFTLCVDDFGVKYVGDEHFQHLQTSLNKHYVTSIDMTGTRYLGLTLDWDYEKREVHLSMLDYVPDALVRFQHQAPRKPQHQPYPHVETTYGAKQQFAADDDTSPLLNAADKKFIQEVVGTFLYYARAVDATMLPALGSIATQQSKPTENTMKKVKQLLDYAATHPDAIITYRASNMVLAAHSDASYLSESKARSRAGGHFFMSENDHAPRNNGAVLTIAQIIKAVMSSAAEAELGALFINSREAVPMRHLLNEMGHKQPPTPMQTDNSTALGVVNSTIQPKRTKPMDMRFYWLRDRINQQQFRTYWAAGPTNNGDYVTKHHSPIHHQSKRPTYLTAKSVLDNLRRQATLIANRIKLTARVC